MNSTVLELSHEGTVLHSAVSGPLEFPVMVFESVGPIHHAVNVPFHDSQARGKAILIHTGWSDRWGSPAYDEPGPYLHEDLVFRFIRARVALVGLDFGRVDATALFEKKIAVVENLRGLMVVPKWGARFRIEPSPVRACCLR